MRRPAPPRVALASLLLGAALAGDRLGAQDSTRRAPPLPAAVTLPADAQLLLRADATASARADGAAVPLTSGGARAALYALRDGPGGETTVDLFVRARRGAEGALRARGFHVGTRAGEWMTARVPLARLREVLAVPGVTSVEIATRARRHDDSSMVDIGATTLRRRTSFDAYQGSTGRGAIIGLVDSGIDFRHPDFREDDTGRSRILWLWDQTLVGNGPGNLGGAAFDYGQECTRDQLTQSACASTDDEGHGTHVAGIAGGDGSGARIGLPDFDVAGVAPGADFIVVKTDFFFTSIVEGVDYIFRRADALGRPAVVNLSLGTLLGPHDGTAAPSLALDALTGPGRVIVASAGNDGNNLNGGPAGVNLSLHAEAAPAVGATDSVLLAVYPHAPNPGGGNDLILLQAFHSPLDTFAVEVVRPNGTSLTLAAGATSASSRETAGAIVLYQGSVAGDSVLGPDLAVGSFAPTSPSRAVTAYLGEWIADGTGPATGFWRLRFTRTAGSGPGTVDVYASFSTINAPVSFTYGARNRRLVSTPADARNVIAVGAYSTRMRWLAVDGRQYTFSASDSVANGDVLLFSSPGPTRDGRTKPDLTAPGRVFSALSRDAGFPAALVSPDSAHVLLEGTSMAAPHVTGAIALLLAARPTLGPNDVRSALLENTRRDDFTRVSRAGDTGLPNATWGFGKLASARALAAVQRSAGRGELSTRRALSTPSPSSRQGTLLPFQSLRLYAWDPESLVVRGVSANAAGTDPAFRLALVLDLDHDGAIGEGEPVVARSSLVALQPTPQLVQLLVEPGTLTLPRGGAVDLVLAGELSGRVPNGSTFEVAVVEDGVTVAGARSGITLPLDGAGAPAVALRTTLLETGERVNLAQNPVRQGPLVVNFVAVPRRATIYDFAGRTVRALHPEPDALRLEWDLRNDTGSDVANGSYLLVLDFPDGVVRRKIFVVR